LLAVAGGGGGAFGCTVLGYNAGADASTTSGATLAICPSGRGPSALASTGHGGRSIKMIRVTLSRVLVEVRTRLSLLEM
jgi:hypothetical protein